MPSGSKGENTASKEQPEKRCTMGKGLRAIASVEGIEPTT